MGVRGRGSPPKTTTESVRAGSAPPTGTSTESSCHEPMERSGSNRHGPSNVAFARRRGMVRRSRSTEKETGSIEPKVGSGHLPTAPTTLRAVARRRDAKPPRRHDGIASTVADFGDPPLAGAFGHLDGGVTRFSRPEASAANVPEQQREIAVVFDGHPALVLENAKIRDAAIRRRPRFLDRFERLSWPGGRWNRTVAGAAVFRPASFASVALHRFASKLLHDAVTPNRHDAVHSLRRITRRRSEKFSLKKPVAETLVSGPGW